jgi:hypothetical protein
MAASDHLNPNQLRKIATAHGDRYFRNYKDPEKRDTGCCYDYSGHFTAHGGVSDVLVQSYEIDDDLPHAVNHVPTSEGPHIVDFTYVQFDPTAQMPIVEPTKTYEKRFTDRGMKVNRIGKPFWDTTIKDLYPDEDK